MIEYIAIGSFDKAGNKVFLNDCGLESVVEGIELIDYINSEFGMYIEKLVVNENFELIGRETIFNTGAKKGLF